MALPHTTETETTWGQPTGIGEGIREDLENTIYDITPTDTPFMSMVCDRGNASSTKHEWLTDQLAAAALNHAIQGDDAAASEAISPIRFANHAQISQKTISITGTMEVVDKAGRRSELSFQLAKRAKEIKRDMEFVMVGQTTVAGNASLAPASGVAGRSGGVVSFFNNTMSTTSGTLPGTHFSRIGNEGGFVESTDILSAPTDGTARALLETHLKTVIQGAWTNGGDPNCIMTAPFNKTVISGMTFGSTRTDESEDKTVTGTIDVWRSDFGTHVVVPNRFQRATDVFAFDKTLWSVDYLRTFRQHALAKTGDSENRQLLCEWTLKCRNQSGNGVISDLTSS